MSRGGVRGGCAGKAGGTLADIVELETAHLDMRSLGDFIAAKNKAFVGVEALPCWSAFGASQLPAVGASTQVRAVAAVSSSAAAAAAKREKAC